jgi:hypothetical protein
MAASAAAQPAAPSIASASAGGSSPRSPAKACAIENLRQRTVPAFFAVRFQMICM